MMQTFNYVRPNSVADAVAALGTGDEVRLLAGGHTMIPTLKQRLAMPTHVVDISGIAALKGIKRDGNAVVIGAMTTHHEVATSAEIKAAIPALAKLAGGIGDPQVRHLGTIGGSVANNDPAADYPAAVLGLNATIITNKREIAADSWFKGLFRTDLGTGEMIIAVRFPIPKKAGYERYEQRASRYCLVAVMVVDTGAGVRVAVTGCGADGVFRATGLEKALAANFSVAGLQGVTVPAAGLMSDMHGNADYRAALIPVMVERAVAQAG
jgi:aerobic carbon-monoxide dehydrogenase medium subunit